MNKKMKMRSLLAGVVVIIALILFVVIKGRGDDAKISLNLQQAKNMTVSNEVTATGTIEPVKLVEVGTQVSGIIDHIYVDYNSEVKAGEVIAEMDRVSLEAELRNATAALSSAKTEYEYQQKNLIRNQKLHQKKLISDTEFETDTYQYDVANAKYEQAQASIVRVKQNLAYATISSPIDGIVVNRVVEEGQTVAAGFNTPTLFTIANDLKQMRVIAEVDEADIGQVKEGQKVMFTVDAFPNDEFEGEVNQIRLEATTTSNVVTYEVVVSAYNPDLKLKPGMTANVTIYTIKRDDALTIPVKALRFEPLADIIKQLGLTIDPQKPEVSAGKKLVWQVKGTTLKAKLVGIGITSGSIVEITSGLQEGESIVVDVAAAKKSIDNSASTNPFMPQRPGRK